jgi:hypothetical protein
MKPKRAACVSLAPLLLLTVFSVEELLDRLLETIFCNR